MSFIKKYGLSFEKVIFQFKLQKFSYTLQISNSSSAKEGEEKLGKKDSNLLCFLVKQKF